MLAIVNYFYPPELYRIKSSIFLEVLKIRYALLVQALPLDSSELQSCRLALTLTYLKQ